MKSMIKLAVCAVVFFLTSCVAKGQSETITGSTGDEQTQASNALNDPYTALGTDDEASQFGDSDVALVASEEAPATDVYAPTDETAADEPTTSDCDVYSLLFRWGQLTGFNSTITSATNWSGDISVNVGTLSVIKTVAFDPNDELMPRTDPKLIEFESKTAPHFDGLRIRYEVCDADKAALGVDETPTLTFNSANVPLTKSFTAAQLVDLNELDENVDANADRFQAQAVKKSDLCQGTLQGQWIQKDADYGVFKGIVVATNGIRVGYVKGFFGQVDSQSKWVAKFISNQGRFGGIMKGNYADNNFTGDIFNGEKNDIGNVEGSFVLPATDGELGTFSANYTLDCANVPSASE